VNLTVAAPPAVAADLILARLAVPAKKPPAPAVIRRDVGKLLYGRELTADEFAAVRDDLVAAGALASAARGSARLTDAGRTRAMAFLGITEFPPRTNWRAVQVKYLFPKAAGLSAEAAARLDKGDKVAAFLLKRKNGLPSGTGDSLQNVMEALACQQLGFPEETTLDGVLRAKLSRFLDADERLTKAQLKAQLPRRAMGTADSKPDTLRTAMIREWLSGSRPDQRPVVESESPAEFDLPAFAQTVKALARTSPPADRFGDNKVFIAAVWRASQREHGFPRLTLPEFKARLVEANRDGRLRLSRADLVQAMDPARVTESETHYLNATFHFVLIEGDQP
jgi:hypothetical protein